MICKIAVAEIEREQLGFDYGQLGSELMQLWHLPPVYQQVSLFHLEPERADKEFRPAVEVVSLAHRFCQDPRRGSHQQLFATSIEESAEFSRLPENIDEIIVDEIETNTDAVLELLWPCGAQDLAAQRGMVNHA